MAMERSSNLLHVYRIDPDDPRIVQRKPNKAGARFTFFAKRGSPAEAKRLFNVLSRTDAAPGHVADSPVAGETFIALSGGADAEDDDDAAAALRNVGCSQ